MPMRRAMAAYSACCSPVVVNSSLLLPQQATEASNPVLLLVLTLAEVSKRMRQEAVRPTLSSCLLGGRPCRQPPEPQLPLVLGA
jgi:hypothetical protein